MVSDSSSNNVYVVWEFTTLNGTDGVKRTVISLQEILDTYPHQPMDQIDWLNLGLFFDDVLLGRIEKERNDILSIHVYGFYKSDEESKKAYDELKEEITQSLINTVSNKSIN